MSFVEHSPARIDEVRAKMRVELVLEWMRRRSHGDCLIEEDASPFQPPCNRGAGDILDAEEPERFVEEIRASERYESCAEIDAQAAANAGRLQRSDIQHCFGEGCGI